MGNRQKPERLFDPKGGPSVFVWRNEPQPENVKLERKEEATKHDCLRASHDSEKCRGPVTGRRSLTTTIYECEFHMQESQDRNRKHREIYPDGPYPPAWWDAENGERWNDDY